MTPLSHRQPEPSSPHPMMNKTPPKTTFWPGTKIVKSTDNGFTRKPGPSLMSSPHEAARAQKQVNAEQARKTQIDRRNGFGGHILGGLSKKAEAQLANRPKSIKLHMRKESAK